MLWRHHDTKHQTGMESDWHIFDLTQLTGYIVDRQETDQSIG